MSDGFKTTIIELDESTGIGTVVLNRPDSLNALSNQLREDIITSLEHLEAEAEEVEGPDLRAVVLEGSGGNFSAGADINEVNEGLTRETSDRRHRKFIREFPVPIIAKVEGYCLGGGFETALSCDFRLAHEDAAFGFPEVDLGIIPGAGGVQLMSKIASPAVAEELAMTGRHISANRAYELDILNQVVESNLDETVRDFAETIASKPPLAIQAVKRSARMATETSLEDGISFDKQQFKPLLGTEDYTEAARAFSEVEYTPTFEGR